MSPNPLPDQSERVHPTVEACVMRSFCDATFAAAERRAQAISRLIEHIHNSERHSGPIEGCDRCRRIHTVAFDERQASDGR